MPTACATGATTAPTDATYHVCGGSIRQTPCPHAKRKSMSEGSSISAVIGVEENQTAFSTARPADARAWGCATLGGTDANAMSAEVHT